MGAAIVKNRGEQGGRRTGEQADYKREKKQNSEVSGSHRSGPEKCSSPLIALVSGLSRAKVT